MQFGASGTGGRDGEGKGGVLVRACGPFLAFLISTAFLLYFVIKLDLICIFLTVSPLRRNDVAWVTKSWVTHDRNSGCCVVMVSQFSVMTHDRNSGLCFLSYFNMTIIYNYLFYLEKYK